MQAQIRLNDTLLDPIDINNGLHQGCCMAPVLFNLYSCVVTERWTERVKEIDGVGMYISEVQVRSKAISEVHQKP